MKKKWLYCVTKNVDPDIGIRVIYITPESYWLQKHCQIDHVESSIQNLLDNNGICELSEATYEWSGDVASAEVLMNSLGFVKDISFSNFMGC